MKIFLIALAAIAALAGAGQASAQSAGGLSDDQQLLIRQIQDDRRGVVMSTLGLTERQIADFTPIYDKYQQENEKLLKRGADVLNKFVSNYDSMTDDAAEKILKDAFDVREERLSLLEDYAKKMGKKLPPTLVLRWVQIENKMMTLLDWQTMQLVPLVR
jgi:flagellar biosynthesis chaperone FliJ